MIRNLYDADRLPPVFMRAFSGSIALAAILFASASPAAFAVKRTDSAPTVIPDHCAGKTGKDRGRCVADTLNDLARQQKAFGEKQRAEKDAWKEENASLGIGPAYQTALREFLKKQEEERKAFNATQLEIRKKLHDEQAAFRKSATSASSAKSRRNTTTVTGDAAAKAKAECAKIVDDRAERQCLKRALNILAPESKGWIDR
jgi:hypothetical protein